MKSLNEYINEGTINKGNADYIVSCVSLGKMNPEGKTIYDWNVWDEWKNADMEIYMIKFVQSYGSPKAVLFGAKGSLKEGDIIYSIDNDTKRKLDKPSGLVDYVCECTYDDFVKEYRKKYPMNCKKPKTTGKASDGLPWTGPLSFGQMYSIKSVTK